MRGHYWNKYVTFDYITAIMFKDRVNPLRVHQKLHPPTPLSPNALICYLRELQISISYRVCHLQRIFAQLQHNQNRRFCPYVSLKNRVSHILQSETFNSILNASFNSIF